MYNNEKCRFDWCAQPYAKANHHPVASLGGDASDTIVRLRRQAGATVELDASASTDPDGDGLSFAWWNYQEAGTYPGAVTIEGADTPKMKMTLPTGAGGCQIHIILEIKDDNPIASLFDYRRVVIDVDASVVTLESIQKK
jgi:hypothetical protein